MNRLENEFRLFKEKQGCTVLRSGWPDFLVIDTLGRIQAVEIKDVGDVVRPNQSAMHKALRSVGLKVVVLRSDDILSEPEISVKFDMGDVQREQERRKEVLSTPAADYIRNILQQR